MRTATRTAALKAAALFLAGTGCVWAQSTLTVFGVVDVSLSRGSGSIAKLTALSQGGLESSRLGFSGEEDLGGGYRASFWLEGDLAPDTGRGSASNPNNQPQPSADPGVATFNRLTFVGLQAPWGRIRAGRDYTPTFAVHALYDPGGAGGLMGSQSAAGSLAVAGHPAGVRASNSVAVAFGELRRGPLLHASYAFGENTSDAGPSARDGHYRGVRLAWTEAHVDVAIAYGIHKNGAVGDIREVVLGGQLEVSKARLWALRVRGWTGIANRMKGSMVALTYPVGAFTLRASRSSSERRNLAGLRQGTTHKAAAGLIYRLSKRTSLYANAAMTRNHDGATGMPGSGGLTGRNQAGSGRDMGLSHSF